MAKAICKTAKYCLSLTAAGFKPELAVVMTRIHVASGNLKETRGLALERNALQTRSLTNAQRLQTELPQRLAIGEPLVMYRYM